MSQMISKKIDQIFSSELNKNRNLILTKPKASNTLIKNKNKNNIKDDYNIIGIFNKRRNEQDNNNKGNIKFINKNQEINRIHSNKQVKSILKKLPDTVIKDYLEDEDSPIAGESKKIKKAKFYIESKAEEKDNNYKLRRIQSKKSLKKLVMIEKQKYPKKETIFDRINRRINESKNELLNWENKSIKKNLVKDSTIVKPKKIISKSIRKSKSKINILFNTKIQYTNIKKYSKKEINPDIDSSFFLINNNDSINSNSKTIKTCKPRKISKLKLPIGNIGSEIDVNQSSRLSKSSSSKEDENNKDDSISKNSNKDVNKSRIKKKVSSFHKDFRKDISGNITGFLNIKYNKDNFNDDKNNNKSKFSKKNSNSSSVSNIIVFENKTLEKEKEIKILDNNNDENDADVDESISKNMKDKNNHKKRGRLSVIPEQDNKKIFYEDIKENIEIIKPENIITLEQNFNKDSTKRRNIEIQKNNIIINNNVSNNITVHHKKNSEEKKDDNKDEDASTNKKIEKNKKGKQYVVKAKKNFPFCCL